MIDLPEMWNQASVLLVGWSKPALFIVGILGGCLWLFGSKLARPAFVIVGMVMTMVYGYYAFQLDSSRMTVEPIVLLGFLATIGSVLAYITFRIWVGILMGVTCGVILATVALFLYDAQTPDYKAAIDEATGGFANNSAELQPINDAQASEAAAIGFDFGEVIDSGLTMFRSMQVETEMWWSAIPNETKQLFIIVCVVGAFIGLGIGLNLTDLTIATGASVLGVAIIIVVASSWMDHDRPTAMNQVYIIGPVLLAATALGVFIQWRAFLQKESVSSV